MKTKRTIHLYVTYEQPHASSADEVIDAIKSCMVDMQADCEAEISRTLEDLGAKSIELSLVVN